MDHQATSPAPPDALAAMLQNATIDKAKGNEFSNTAGDMFKFVQNNYNFTKEGESLMLESSDAINHLLKAIPHFLAEVRKNDQSRSTVGETGGSDADVSGPEPQAVTTDHTLQGDPVDVIDIMPPEPSSLPVISIADRYTRSMLKCLAGYPLYDPKPFSELSNEYPRNGVNVGDVGFVRGDGSFDFLFNICPSKNGIINPPNLPDGFSLEIPHATKDRQPLPRNTSLFQKPITRTNSGEYICEGHEGAILELPEGAIEDEATNIRPFEKLAARHGVQWYGYTMTRGRKISNGSLYLITSSTKCTQWGTAVFDRPCAPGQGLRFDRKMSLPFSKSTSKYHWKGSRAFTTKASNPNQGDAPNQCVFLRGYKIMIRQDIFDNLCNDQLDQEMPSSSPQAGGSNMTRQRATRIRGGGGPDPASKILTGGGLFSRTAISTETKSDEVVLRANFNPSLVHPSDLINAALLSQNPNTKVALTHDDVWCNLLRDNFPKLDYTTLINIARSYTNAIDEYKTVSLQKVSDSRNVLEESNCPLQRTETVALQGPPTIPDDDYVPVQVQNSPTLPCELVERIILLLDTEYMLTCRLVNREFDEIIQSSTLLQYCLACKAAGVIDNPRSPISYGERLEALWKREEAWRALKPVFETTIKVNHQPSPRSVYDLTEGAFFLDDSNLKDLNYCHLPSSPQDIPRWNRIPCHGPGEGIFVNFNIAVYEHDLIINICSSGVGNQQDTQRYSLDLVLLKFSTGEYHPLARHPQIHVQRSPEVQPLVMSTIVGDNLALIVHSRNGTFPDKLFIFDWKTGHKRLQHETTENAYSDLVFVSPEILLVPNFNQSHFEVWHFPLSHLNPKPPVQILALQIPAISRDYSLLGINFNCNPNTFLHSMPSFPPRPFFFSPENSIIIANCYLESLQETQTASYTLIMPRRALLEMIRKWTSPSLRRQTADLPTWLTNEVTVHKIADPDDGSVRLDAQSKFKVGTATFSTSPTSPTSHISADSGPSSVSSGPSTDSSITQYDFLQAQWVDWGPPISRWFQERGIQARFSTSFGQRFAFSVPNPRDRSKLIVSVADFNQHNFRRNADMTTQFRGEGNARGANDNNEKGKEKGEEVESEIFDHEGVFSEDVYMGLKCVVYHAPDEYDFDAVLMDEERLLGLKLNRDDYVESIKVLYFG